MTDDPLDDAVAGQYRQWVYPEPITNLDAWLEGNWEWFDPSHAQPLLWPDRDPRPDLTVLVAGCGANQAAVIAHTNPSATVTGIDVSDASLNHQRRLARSHGLKNLDLHLLPIERIEDLGRDFDLVISTGVLHHMADPVVGMASLGRCLRPDGVLAVMLYARYGRLGVAMLQETFRDLGLSQDEESLEVVKSTIGRLPPDHPLRAYLTISPDLAHDTGLVDTFLHERDRDFTVDDCLELVDAAGLKFDDWFLKAPYHPYPGLGPTVLSALSRIPVRRRWAAMERLNWRNGCHFFTACRPERPRSSYVVDFDSPAAVDYRPSLRHKCAVTDVGIARSDWVAPLDDRQAALIRRIDGRRTLAEIANGIVDGATARALFEALWRLDFISVRLATGSSEEVG
jgi:SAM-dependent methyltransferase